MLKLNSITFKDDETGKIIEVNPFGQIVSDHPITADEACTSGFYAGMILAGGFKALEDFSNFQKNN